MRNSRNTQKNDIEHRKVYIDYAKGIGIFLVVFAHAIELDNNSRNIRALFTIVKYIYSFHMPLFFAISGYIIGMKKSEKTLGTLAKKYLVPYYLVSLLYIMIRFVKHEAWLGRVYSTLCGRGQAPIWFLVSLFISIILLNLVLRNINKKQIVDDRTIVKDMVVLEIICVVLTILGARAVKQRYISESMVLLYLFQSIFRIFPSLFFVAFGYCCGIFRIFERDKIKEVMICITSFLVWISFQFLSNNSVNMHLMQFDNSIIFFVTGCMGTMFLVSLCTLLPRNIQAISQIGRVSLHIMWIHYPPMPILSFAFAMFASAENCLRMFCPLIVFAISALLAFGFKIIIEYILNIIKIGTDNVKCNKNRNI